MSPAATAINTHTAQRGMGVRSLPDLFCPGFDDPGFPEESGKFLRLLDCGGGGGSLLTGVMLRADVARCLVVPCYGSNPPFYMS